MANDLVKRLAAFANCEANELEDTLNEAAIRIEELENLLRLCLEDYGSIHFTDRHGMADRIRRALKTKEPT